MLVMSPAVRPLPSVGCNGLDLQMDAKISRRMAQTPRRVGIKLPSISERNALTPEVCAHLPELLTGALSESRMLPPPPATALLFNWAVAPPLPLPTPPPEGTFPEKVYV